MAAFRAELQKAHRRHDLALCLLIPGIVVLWVGGLAPAAPDVFMFVGEFGEILPLSVQSVGWEGIAASFARVVCVSVGSDSVSNGCNT